MEGEGNLYDQSFNVTIKYQIEEKMFLKRVLKILNLLYCGEEVEFGEGGMKFLKKQKSTVKLLKSFIPVKK